MTVDQDQNKAYQRRWWWALGLGMAVVFGVNFYFIWLSSSASPALVTPAYYEQSLKYQIVLDETEATHKSGFRLAVNTGHPFSVDVLDAHNISADVTGTVEMYRPNDPGQDVTFALSDFGLTGQHKFESGRWDLSVQVWHADGRRARFTRSLSLPYEPRIVPSD